jgi:predicted nuclease with TOPRIM domain
VEPSEAIAFVRRYNAWRRNEDDLEMPRPKDIGHAIDALCDHAERLDAELAVWKHEAKRLEDQLKAFNETAIQWWCEYQDLKARARES